MGIHAFSDFIRFKRHYLGLTQAGVAHLLKGEIPQATLSAWETGRQLPHPKRDKPRLIKLAYILDCTIDDLIGALEKQPRGRARGLGLGDESYLDAQQDYTRDECNHEVDIWLFGPEMSRVGSSRIFRERWVQNLRDGISYHILWLLGTMRYGVLRGFVSDLRVVCKGLTNIENAGRIVHHAFAVFPEESSDATTYNENHSDYKSLTAANIPGHICQKVLMPNNCSSSLRADVIRFGSPLGPFGSVELWHPRSIKYSPTAAFNLPKAPLWPMQVEGSVWFFMGPDEALAFERFVKVLTKEEEK